MAPMLRFFRHGDRRLALFNDSLEEDGILIDLVLTRSETKGQRPLHAPRPASTGCRPFRASSWSTPASRRRTALTPTPTPARCPSR